jgi:hypothetical protein
MLGARHEGEVLRSHNKRVGTGRAALRALDLAPEDRGRERVEIDLHDALQLPRSLDHPGHPAKEGVVAPIPPVGRSHLPAHYAHGIPISNHSLTPVLVLLHVSKPW